MGLQQDILIARGKNWARRVMQKADELCEQRKDDIGLMLDILSGNIYDRAQALVAEELKTGVVDGMFIPITEQ